MSVPLRKRSRRGCPGPVETLILGDYYDDA